MQPPHKPSKFGRREIAHRDIVQKRNVKQEEIAKSKGRPSKDIFEINDEVTMQDPRTKRWTQHGVIKSKRTSDDESCDSYDVEMTDSGLLTSRNKRFLKHMTQP